MGGWTISSVLPLLAATSFALKLKRWLRARHVRPPPVNICLLLNSIWSSHFVR